MASLIVLKGSNNTELDLTRYIPMKKYNINVTENYEEWTDSNYTIHRQKTDEKAEGDFTLRFPSISLYQQFVNFLETNKDSSTGAISCSVFCMNKYAVRNIYAFLTFNPADELPLLADNKSDGFSVVLQERGQ